MTMYRMHVKAIMLMIVSYLYLSPDVFGQSARVAKPPKNTGDKLLYKAGDSNFIIGSAQPDTLKGVLFGVVSDTGRSSNKHNFGAFLLPRIDSVHIQRHLATKSVATQGSLLYDSVKKAPRYFDGKTWQTLLSTARQPIYTSNDSLTGDRTVTNRGKKLVFTLDTINTKRSSFSIGQKKPIYPVEIATTSYIKSKTGPNSGADSVALRISHNVMEGKTSYGLLLNERSNKATGRSAIGFMGGNDTTDSLVKARIWAQVGQLLKGSKLGIDVADSGKRLHTRMVIDSVGRVGMGTDKPTERLHIKNSIKGDSVNYIRMDVDSAGKGGIWFSKSNGQWGWKIEEHERTNKLRFERTGNGSGGNVRYMVITDSGKVGLGTENPTHLLHLKRDSADNFIRIEAGGTNGPKSGIWLTERNNQWGWRMEFNTGKIAHNTSNYFDAGEDFLDFVQTRPDRANSGNSLGNWPVLRLVTDPSKTRPYDVVKAVVVISPKDGSANQEARLRVQGSAVMNSWVWTSSDSVLKRDIHTLSEAQSNEQILSLRPVSYRMKKDPQKIAQSDDTTRFCGFIAQEMENGPLASLVMKNEGDTMENGHIVRRVAYSGIIAPLVAFSQALYREKEALKREVKDLREQSSFLQQRVSTLEKQMQAILNRLNGEKPQTEAVKL